MASMIQVPGSGEFVLEAKILENDTNKAWEKRFNTGPVYQLIVYEAPNKQALQFTDEDGVTKVRVQKVANWTLYSEPKTLLLNNNS